MVRCEDFEIVLPPGVYSSVHLPFPSHLRLSLEYLPYLGKDCPALSSATGIPCCRAPFPCILTCSLRAVSRACAVFHVGCLPCRLWWICAASLPARTRARACRPWPRRAACARPAGPAPTATCPASPARWQLHREVKQHPLAFSSSVPRHLLPPCAQLCLQLVTSRVEILSAALGCLGVKASLVLPITKMSERKS